MRNGHLSKKLLQEIDFQDFIGKSAALNETLQRIPIIAGTDESVLITGETGVGKEICARSIHHFSDRADQPFVPFNCSSVPPTLIESTLFGHKRGAFTDAREKQVGMLARAEGGTLFLDEIGELEVKAQASLLRLLQEKTYFPLGESKEVKCNVRFVAATNVEPEELIKKKAFRPDLFYRFSFPLKMPPLRQRRNDIPLLADFFIQKYNQQYGRQVKGIFPNALKRLIAYEWPGNVRELENVIKEAVLFEEANEYLKLNKFKYKNEARDNINGYPSLKEAKDNHEKDYLLNLLDYCDGNITLAAKIAKKERRDFYRLLHKHKINRNSL